MPEGKIKRSESVSAERESYNARLPDASRLGMKNMLSEAEDRVAMLRRALEGENEMRARGENEDPRTGFRLAPSDRKMAKGGAVKMKSGGVTRGDGCATRGKTKGRMV